MTRRALVLASGAGVAVAAVWASSPPAIAATIVDAAVDELLAGRAFVESPGVHLDLPERFDYGNSVPLAVTIDSPASAAGYVQRVSVFAEGNPFPEVASFQFAPDSGRASVSTRIRLNEGEREVVAVAELSDGTARLGRRSVVVALSGCSVETGVEVDHAMPRPEPRLKLPARARRDEIVEIRTMISHWMETGLRNDTAGRPIQRRIITQMTCSRDGRPVFVADLSPAIAANAYLTFPLLARESGVLDFAWHEDGGAVYRASHPLTVT